MSRKNLEILEKNFLGYAVGVNKELRVAALIGHHFKIRSTVHKHMRKCFVGKYNHASLESLYRATEISGAQF